MSRDSMSGEAFFARVQARAVALAQARCARWRREIVQAIEADFPDLSASVAGEDVAVEGRGLLERWLRDARLRDAVDRAHKGGGR